MCYVKGVANSGKRKYAVFFIISYGVSDSLYLVSFFRDKLLELLSILDNGFLMVQVLLDYYLEFFFVTPCEVYSGS
jgi:hypothetical protein